MNLASARAALAEWIEARTDLPVHVERRPRGWPSQDGGYVILALRERSNVGVDMITSSYDDSAPDGEEIEVAQEGARTLTARIQVRTFRQSDGRDAAHYAAILRNSACLPQLSRSVFGPAGIEYAAVIGEVDVDAELDGRDVSVAQLDLLFNATSSVSDEPTGYVEHLEGFELYDVDSPSPPMWEGDIDL